MSYDIYVPLRGPAIMVPNSSSTLGVAFGPQAPPSPSQAPPPPPAPPSSALYGPLPSQVTASLTPPHGQGPPTGQVPVITDMTTGGMSAATQSMSALGIRDPIPQLPSPAGGPQMMSALGIRDPIPQLPPPAGGPQTRSPVQLVPPSDQRFLAAGTGDYVMPGRSGPTQHRGGITPL
jgi:hypothetical protein